MTWFSAKARNADGNMKKGDSKRGNSMDDIASFVAAFGFGVVSTFLVSFTQIFLSSCGIIRYAAGAAWPEASEPGQCTVVLSCADDPRRMGYCFFQSEALLSVDRSASYFRGLTLVFSCPQWRSVRSPTLVQDFVRRPTTTAKRHLSVIFR
jgi:hypothetical protein